MTKSSSVSFYVNVSIIYLQGCSILKKTVKNKMPSQNDKGLIFKANLFGSNCAFK